MYRLFNCIIADHDPWLTLFAGVICIAGILSSFRAYRQALDHQQRRWHWMVFAGTSGAAGIWATHFIAMLAYNSPVPVSYHFGATALSLVLACLSTTLGFALAASRSTPAILTGGLVIGCGIGAMHFTGMSALAVPGTLSWDFPVMASAVFSGVFLSCVSLWVFHQQEAVRGYLVSSALMVGAICSLHFAAMSAVTIVPDPLLMASASSVDRIGLAIGIAGMVAFCMVTGLFAATIERLRGAVYQQLRRLEKEVDERRRAEHALQSRQTMLMSHQSAIADLMRDDNIRTGSLEEAMNTLMRVLGHELGICRAGYILVDADRRRAIHRSIYVVTTESFDTPATYGSEQHIARLINTSSHGIVAVDDTSIDNPLSVFDEEYYKATAICSTMHAPIFSHGDLVGFITCACTTGHDKTWNAEHRVLALGIANLAAVVVERHERLELEARAKASAARLGRQQTLLKELIGSASLRTGEVGEMFKDVAIAVCAELCVDRVSVRFFSSIGLDQSYTEVFADGARQLIAAPRDTSRPYPSVFEAAIAHGPIVVADCKTDPLTCDFYETGLAPRRIRAMLHVPIRSELGLIGIVACSTYDTPRQWAPEDELLATSIANVLALVCERRLRLRSEDSLREANRAAEEANKAKSLFLANMSHEIRTPMNGVLGMADVLSRSGLTERQRRLAGTITESARSLLTIINDILDISRIEGGKFELEAHDFDLGSCIEDAVELLAEQAYKRGLDLNLFIDERVAGTVRADSVRLRQVLVNLIGNAIKFTERGEVSVSVVTAPQEGAGTLRFTVRDTGIGIDSEVQKRLFQPFTQADTSITRRFGGTGLGLSISRHLVEMMGGRMEIESAPGSGTTIWFELPLEVCQSPVQRKARSSLAGRRVLVVDDRATNREIICSYLASSGAVIEASADNADAIRALDKAVERGEPYELAIVDLIMEGGDGLQLTRHIKQTPALAEMKVILLSSLAWSSDIGDARSVGVDKFLHKPIRRTDLLKGALDCLSGTEPITGSNFPGPDDAPATYSLGLSVLVAEDNPVNQVVAQEYLSNLGCTVTIAENGRQALDELARNTFDAVLMDCHMPEMDGYAATRELRRREALARLPALPVIAVTANAYESDRQLCFDAGMNNYLSKPYSEAQLAAVLEGLERRREPESGNSDVAHSDQVVEKASVVVQAQPPVQSTGEIARVPAVRANLREKLMLTYRRHIANTWPTLEHALENKDMAAIALIAHSIKAGSGNVGEMETSACCSVLELAGRNGDLERCRELVARLKPLLDASIAVSPMTEKSTEKMTG